MIDELYKTLYKELLRIAHPFDVGQAVETGLVGLENSIRNALSLVGDSHFSLPGLSKYLRKVDSMKERERKRMDSEIRKRTRKMIETSFAAATGQK